MYSTRIMSAPEKQISYIRTKDALKILGVTVLTLHNWEKANKIDTIRGAGGHRRYNVDKYLKMQADNTFDTKQKITTTITNNIANDNNNDNAVDNNNNIDNKKKTNLHKTEKINICYIRVACVGNKNISKQQKECMKVKYAGYKIIEDVGSAENFNKKGLKEIIDMVTEKKINNIVVANKNNMSQFTLDLLNYLLAKYDGGKITVDNCDNPNELDNDIDNIIRTLGTVSMNLLELKKNHHPIDD